MAERENIRDRVRKINPEALLLIDKVEEAYKKKGGCGVSVDLTSDMTPLEEEMALFEGFLKEGYDIVTASRKAKEWLALSHSCTSASTKSLLFKPL